MLACLSGSFSGLPVLGGQILRTNGPNGETAAAVVDARAAIAGTEAEEPSAVRTACVERRRPVVAVLPSAVKTRIVAIPGCGQEYGTARIAGLLTRYLVTAYTVHGGPGPGAVVYQFSKLIIRGHAPAATPFLAGYVITQLKGGSLVNTSSVTLSVVLVDLDILITVTAGAETVVLPCISGLGACFAPSIVVSVGAGT